MSCKNILIVLCLKAIRKFSPARKKSTAPLHFLVVTTTALGDSLWATPAIRALKTSHPTCFLSVLTSPIGKEVLSDNPYVDKMFVLKKPHILSLLKIFFQLKKKPIDKAYIFHTSQRMILPFCYLLHPQEIIGTAGINKGLDSLLSTALKQKPEHEIQRRLRIVNAPETAHPLLELLLSDNNRQQAISFIEKNRLNDSSLIIGMHPGAKDKFKQWPPECFIELGNRLKQSLNCSILITGSPHENELTEQIALKIPGAIALTEKVPLKTLAALIKKLDLFITNDTGPMHVAFAMQTPTVSLFTVTDSNLCGPYLAQKASVIQKHKTCTPCLRKKCMLPFCMLQISPKEVEEKVLYTLKGTK